MKTKQEITGNWLVRYTKMPLEKFGKHILLTNFNNYVALTPEEWVRQHFTHFLVEHRHYPAALLGNEITVQLNGVARRCDSVLYSRDGGRPRMIVEYKAPEVPVTQAVPLMS